MRKTYIGLDGLRGAAALGVFGLHILTNFTADAEHHFHAFLAVDLFFMLSGFVIAHVYEQKLATGRLSLKAFTAIRLKRLLPLAWLGTVIGFAALLCIAPYHELPPLKLTGMLAFGLLLLPQVLLPFYLAFPLNPVMWSLSLEVMANIVYAAVIRHTSTFRLCGLSAVGFAGTAAFGLIHGGTGFGHHTITFFTGFFRIAFSFPIGIVLYRLKDRADLKAVGDRLARFGAPGLLAILLASFAMPYLLPMGVAHAVWDLAVIGLVFPVLVLAGAAVTPTGRTAAICTSTGGFSYALYALHYPILAAGARLGMDPLTAIASAAIALAVCYLGWRLFDTPLQVVMKSLYAKRALTTDVTLA